MADDLTRPFIGYRSAGRRPESQQNRRASADAPLAALRGAVSGVLGAPGDIESLVRMLPGLNEQTVLPTSEDIEKRLPMRSVSQTPAGRAFTTGGQLGGGFYTGPGSPLRAIAALPSAVSRAGRDFVRSGNWGRVGDLKNAGLIDARAAGNPLPGRPAFMTEDEFKAFQNELSGETPPAEGFARGGQVRGYQAGGVVNLAKATAKNIGELVRKYTPETQLNEATQVAEEIKKLGPQFLPKIEQTNGGSVYLTVSKSPLTKQGVPSKNRNSTPIDFKARFADHPSYWGSTISSDPVTGNTPETIVKMFKHKIGSGDLPAYSEARFNPADKYGYVTDIRREEGVSHKGNPVMKTIKDERPFTFYEPGARGKGYAEGGQVTGANFPTDDFDPDRIDAIVAELHALNAG